MKWLLNAWYLPMNGLLRGFTNIKKHQQWYPMDVCTNFCSPPISSTSLVLCLSPLLHSSWPPFLLLPVFLVHLIFFPIQLRLHPPPRQDKFKDLFTCAAAKKYSIDTSSNLALAASLNKATDDSDPLVNRASAYLLLLLIDLLLSLLSLLVHLFLFNSCTHFLFFNFCFFLFF